MYFVGSLHAGGLERFVTSVCTYAVAHDIFKPFVVCLADKAGIFYKQLEKAGVEVAEAPAGWNRKKAANRQLADVIRNFAADIVHSQVNFSLVQQYMAARHAGCRFMVTERNMYRFGMAGRLRRILQYYYLRQRGVLYSANSGMVRKHLAALVFAKEENIPVVNNGYEVITAGQRPYSRQELNLPPAGLLLGYVARMAAHKGHFLFLRVLRHLLDQGHTNIYACLIGDGPERQALEQEVERLKLTGHIRFLGVRNDLHKIYPLFDLQLLLSDYEGMPNVVLEGMAHGVPVVATPVGNVADMFADGGGVLITDKHPASIAAQIAALLQNVSLRQAIAARARQIVDERYSIAATVARLCSIYGVQTASHAE